MCHSQHSSVSRLTSITASCLCFNFLTCVALTVGHKLPPLLSLSLSACCHACAFSPCQFKCRQLGNIKGNTFENVGHLMPSHNGFCFFMWVNNRITNEISSIFEYWVRESIEVPVKCAQCTDKLFICTMGVKCGGDEEKCTFVPVGKWHKILNKRLF